MAWHKPILDDLRAGRTTTVEHKGPAMFGRIGDGQLATVSPANDQPLSPDDLVFVYCQGNQMIRLIAAVDNDRYQIADARGKSLGWVHTDDIHGKVIAISTPEDLLATLTIDGTETSPFNVWIHHQTDPYPGGHTYHWLIPRRLVGPFHAAEFASCRSPNHDQQRNWLLWLQPILCNWSCNLAAERFLQFDHPVDYQYVLNTIESLNVTDDRLALDGVCSPFVRTGDYAEKAT
jgi:hypothetical protein